VKPQPDKQFILDSLAAIASGAGRTPSRSEFFQLSGISEHAVSQFFPTWNDAVTAAGLQPFVHNWPQCPAQIEVLELSSLIKSLPNAED
jgi:hypothetical protein